MQGVDIPQKVQVYICSLRMYTEDFSCPASHTSDAEGIHFCGAQGAPSNLRNKSVQLIVVWGVGFRV